MKPRTVSQLLLFLVSFALASSLAAARQEPVDVKSGWIQLTVVDVKGAPMKNVTVYLDRLDGDDTDDRPVRYTTGENGVVEVTVPAGAARKLIISPLRTRLRRDVLPIAAVEEGEDRPITYTVFEEDNAHFNGRVLDAETKEPVPGAVIHADSSSSMIMISRGSEPTPLWRAESEPATADPQGLFRLPAATWRYTEVTVSAPGYALKSTSVKIEYGLEENEQPQDILLAKGARALVRVVEPPAGAELRATFAGEKLYDAAVGFRASVDIYALVRQSGPRYIVARAIPMADDGDVIQEFVLEGLPPKIKLDLGLYAPDKDGTLRLLSARKNLALSAKDELTTVVMDGAASGRIEVRLVRDGAAPPASMEVWCCVADDPVRPTGFRYSRVPDFVQSTDAQGRATFADLAPGRYHVTLRPERPWIMKKNPEALFTRTVEVRLEQGEVAPPIRLELCKPLAIRGDLVIEPELQRNVYRFSLTRLDDGATETVHLFSSRGTAIEAEPLVPGSYRLELDEASLGAGLGLRPRIVEAGTVDLKLVPEKVSTLEVHVVDGATGEPLKKRRGLSIRLTPKDEHLETVTKKLVVTPKKKFKRLFAGDYDVELTDKAGSVIGSARVTITGEEAVQTVTVDA